MSLYNQVIDVADDYNKSLLTEILREFQPPELLKTAQVATTESREKLGREAFALVVLTKEGSELRKYPIQDAANTWLSCRYFEKTAHKLPPKAKDIAAGMLKRACAQHKLEETPMLKSSTAKTIGGLYNEIYDRVKTASPITFVSPEADNSKHFFALGQNYAMPSPEFVKQAEQYFVQYEKEFADAEDRSTFAANVMARAEELRVPLEHQATMAKYASVGYGDRLEAQISMRRDLLQARPEMSAALEKIAAYKAELPAPQFAKLLYTFDKKASLSKYYGSHLADAFKATFEQKLTKQSSGYKWECDDDELSCNEKELTDAFEKKANKIKGYFGETVAESLKKHGCSIFDSLPRDAKETIAKIAKGQI